MSGVEILDNGTRVLTAPRAAFGGDALLWAALPSPAGPSGPARTCAAGARNLAVVARAGHAALHSAGPETLA